MTSWMWWVSGGVILIVTVATLAWTYGARIDRLHRRIASARLRLDRHLVKRSAEAVRLADSGALTKEDSNALREVATAALSAAEVPLAVGSLGGFARQGRGSAEDSALRRHAESSLSQVLRSTLTPELRGELEQSVLTHTQLDVLASATYRARVARNLHNQDVSNVRRLRAKPIARVFHLSGRAPLPQYVNIDDQ